MDLTAEAGTALDSLVGGVGEVLLDQLVGVYLVGSFALGCADERSDVDVVVVVDGRPREAEVELGALHTRLTALGGWASRLECSYADLADLRSPMTLGRRWLRLEEGALELVASAADNTAHVRWVLRERGVVLQGPPPRELVAEVGPSALRAEALGLARARAEALEDDPACYADARQQPDIVLTACRTLHTASTAEVTGKAASTRWALDHLDPVHRPVLEAVLARRGGPGPPTRALVWDVVRLAGQAALEARD